MSSFDKRALVFAHYHRAGLLRSDTIEMLNYVGKTFFDKIVVVSTHLTDKEKSKISDFCEVIVRENIGYDFFSYSVGIQTVFSELPNAQITLMNSSFVVLDPSLLGENYFIKHCHSLPTDFFGLTFSTEKFPHIQSFLMSFNPNVWSEGKFFDWWRDMTPENDREVVIDKYEVGLSRFMTEQRVLYTSAVYFEPTERIGNPSHGAAKEILRDFGLAKIEFYRDNPMRLDLSFLIDQTGPHALGLLKEGIKN